MKYLNYALLNNFKTSSYITKVIEEAGATLRQFGIIPLKKPRIPSYLDFHIWYCVSKLKRNYSYLAILSTQSITPLYFTFFSNIFVTGFKYWTSRCCNLLLITWYGYVDVAAAIFETPPSIIETQAGCEFIVNCSKR